tara:strand:+ start:2039 stop:3325 length:1287 start_codon:yes stop_codon:yes gene_type:complete
MLHGRLVDIDDALLPSDESHFVHDQDVTHGVFHHPAQAVAQTAQPQKDRWQRQNEPLQVGTGCVSMRYDGKTDPRMLVGVVVQNHTAASDSEVKCATTESVSIARADIATFMPKFQVQTLKLERVTQADFDRDWCLYEKKDSPVVDQLRHLAELKGWLGDAMDTTESAPKAEPCTNGGLISRPRGRAPRHKTWDAHSGGWVPQKHVSNTDWQNARLSRRDGELREFALRHATLNVTLNTVRMRAFAHGCYFQREAPDTFGTTMYDGLHLCWNSASVTQTTLNAFTGKCGLYDGDVPFEYNDGTHHTLVAQTQSGAICGLITVRFGQACFQSVGLVAVLVVDLIVVDPGHRSQGLASHLLQCGVAASRKQHQTVMLLCEATQVGPGWAWWKHRVTPKLPLAIVLLLQIHTCIDNSELAVGALPCGSLLL